MESKKKKGIFSIQKYITNKITEKDNFPFQSALKITLIYWCIGFLWVLLSDRAIHLLPLSREILSIVSMIKGWIYVLVTGILLFSLVFKSLERVQRIYKALKRNYEELIITEQELQEKVEKLTDSEERYKLVSEASYGGMWDEREDIRYFSDEWYKMTGYTREEVERLGDWRILIHPEDREEVERQTVEHKRNLKPKFSIEFRLKFKNRQYRWMAAKVRFVYDKEGKVIRTVGSHTDINVIKNSQKRLEDLAYKDFLTKLSNRSYFYKYAMEDIFTNPNMKKALIFFDIDDFKHINDTLGHSIGDKVIIAIGKRLKRLEDSTKTAYRNSGDEFAIYISRYKDIDEIENFAKELIRSIGAPFNIDDCVLNISISIGIALYPFDGKDIDTLFKSVDMAMYKSKQFYGPRYTFYNKAMDREIRERMELGNELSKALDRGELSLNFQPQLDAKRGKISYIEALLRWENGKFGQVPPSKFIKIAEEMHLINPIGDWVIENACKFLKELHNKGLDDVSISVNVSILQLMEENFNDKLIKILNDYGILPKYFELEVTESVFMESYEFIKIKLEQLQSIGISISIDDFGTGYSSLSYLANVPINCIKIDKTFIDNIGIKQVETSLVEMIIQYGHKLGLSIVAEGVERKEQFELLEQQKCHRIQGYYISKPLDSKNTLNLLSR